MADGKGPDTDVSIDSSHPSGHFIGGTEGTHAISQDITTDKGTAAESNAVSYTDVSNSGDVGQSGFDDKA